MNLKPTQFNGLFLINPISFSDDRGFFLETYQATRYRAAGITDNFVQDNQSRSRKGVLRGLHFQVKRPQAQLLTVLRGRIFDAVVDLRSDSQTFGQWYGVELSDDDVRQVYMGPGFAHGFCVLSDWADLHYKVTQEYDPHDEGGLLWCDPQVGIQWPVENPIVSTRDAVYPILTKLGMMELPNV